ncbi:MAG: 3-dehydroquinate synthase [Candidatus Omnitrophica bacterium]|nr:3-dehydroquinate synthase [Candidatus Omnitrophota bacterium]
MKTIKVKLLKNPYNIYIKQNLFGNISGYLKAQNLGNFALIVTSRRVFGIYKKNIDKSFADFDRKVIVLPDGEEAKTKTSLFRIIDELIRAGKISRKIFIVCLGGGTVGDVGGFAASIYKRGIPYIQVPTTLLSAIDASIGGKTAIDLREAKNILGTFYQPRAVFIDPVFLNTLDKRRIAEGMAEAVKYAVIDNPAFFNFLAENSAQINSLKPSAILKVIDTCARIKAKVVEADETEKKGIRTILNFGHTFAHALEAASCYKKVSHGQAVSIGMLYAAYLSAESGLCGENELYRIRDLVKKFNLPVKCTCNKTAIYAAMSHDKKNISGKFRLVLLKKIGKVEVVDGVSDKLIAKSIKEFNAFI